MTVNTLMISTASFIVAVVLYGLTALDEASVSMWGHTAVAFGLAVMGFKRRGE